MLRRYGYGPPPVHYVGKTATFMLLAAFPVLLLAPATHGGDGHGRRARSAGALAWWGLVLYWVAGGALRGAGGPAGARGRPGPGGAPR